MALGTYSELQAAVKDWLAEDTLLDAVLPDMIAFIESEMNYGRAAAPGREPIEGFRVRDMQKRELINLTSGTPQYGLPDDFLEMQSLDSVIDNYPPLTQLTMTQIQSRERSDPVRFYAFGWNQIFLNGVPGDNPGNLVLLYYGKIPALSDENPTNWVLEKHPNVYLYGTLIHAAAYLKQDGSKWEMMYEQAREGVIRSDNAAQNGPVSVMSMAYSVV